MRDQQRHGSRVLLVIVVGILYGFLLRPKAGTVTSQASLIHLEENYWRGDGSPSPLDGGQGTQRGSVSSGRSRSRSGEESTIGTSLLGTPPS